MDLCTGGQCLWRPKGGIGAPEAGVTGSWGLPNVGTELGSLAKQYALPTAVPSIFPALLFLFKMRSHVTQSGL